jgi:hypothetical protein
MDHSIKIIEEAYKAMYAIITEELHPELKSILDSDTISPDRKNLEIAKKSRKLIESGQSTGLESDKPKKGSSRAYYAHSEPKTITLDGKETQVRTGLKIAFSGELDKHHGEESLLGMDQNNIESDHYLNSNYGIIGKNSDGTHKTNQWGVLAPVFEAHHENHYLECGHCSKLTSEDLSEATKTPEFPKGLKHKEIQEAMIYQHRMAHGRSNPNTSGYSDEHLEKVSDHPWVSNAIDMMHNSGMNPMDLDNRNMGTFTHPVTGKKHLAILDWGFSSDIEKKYAKARAVMYKKKRPY